MRCSDCSQTVAPVVALDIDGTLGDYHGHFIRFLTEYIDWNRYLPGEELYDGSGPFKAWALEKFGITEATWYDAKLAYRQGAQKRSMPIYPGAARMVRAIREAGAEVWITTTRPYLRLDGIDPDTREWLRRHDIGYDFLMYDEEKYRRLRERLDYPRVVAVLDDLPEMISDAQLRFGGDVPIMRGTHYNRAWGGVTLGQATNTILERVEQWREANE